MAGAPPYAYYFVDNIEIYDCDSITGLDITNNPVYLKIHPNPVSNNVEVNFLSQGNSKLELFDAKGQRVKEINFQSNFGPFTEKVDLSEVKNGMYLLKLSTGKYFATEKIIVQH